MLYCVRIYNHVPSSQEVALEFGVHLPHVGPFATPEAISEVARKAEELGYHSIWVSDHIITPRQLDSHYPGGHYPVQPEWPFLEATAPAWRSTWR